MKIIFIQFAIALLTMTNAFCAGSELHGNDPKTATPKFKSYGVSDSVVYSPEHFIFVTEPSLSDRIIDDAKIIESVEVLSELQNNQLVEQTIEEDRLIIDSSSEDFAPADSNFVKGFLLNKKQSSLAVN